MAIVYLKDLDIPAVSTASAFCFTVGEGNAKGTFRPFAYRIGLADETTQQGKAFIHCYRRSDASSLYTQSATIQIGHDDLPGVIEQLQAALHALNMSVE